MVKLQVKYMLKSKGFSLLEVLIALTVLTIAFTALVTSLSKTTRTFIYLQDKTAAIYIAENVIAAAQIGLLNTTHKNETMFNQQYHWIAVSTQDKNITRINVVVFKNNNSALLTVSGFLPNA